MKKLDLKQNSPEWDLFRRTHIGASDAPSICGVDPYCTPYKKWKQKALGEKGYSTQAMERGSALEAQARHSACLEYGLNFEPVCALHDQIDFMMASLDGYDEAKHEILEVKCPGPSMFEKIKSGNVPKSYIYQMHQQMEVVGKPYAYLYVYDGKEGLPLTIERDQSIIEEIIEKEREFYRMLINFEAPEDTHQHREDVDWQKAAEAFLLAKDDYERADAYLKECRQALIDVAKDESCKGYGVTATKIISKGNVEYAKIPELKAIDLNAYRKPARESWRVA